ncbi:MAG: CofH family radical SAM protein [Thermoplasmatota archaeon]
MREHSARAAAGTAAVDAHGLSDAAFAALGRRLASGGSEARLTDAEAIALLQDRRVAEIGAWADRNRRMRHGRKVYYRADLNINHTNVCAADCGFCAFYRKPGQEGSYTMSLEQIDEKVRKAASAGVSEFHVVGGLDPDLPLTYFEEMFRRMKRIAPGAQIQGLTGVEIDFIAKIEKRPIREVLVRLRDAGLDSIPGGGAEVFHPEARRRMLATKISGERFLDVHREAHALGIPTNVSILFGHVETAAERIDHLRRIRDLQDQTGGFEAFVLLAWNPENTELHRQTGATGPSALDVLRFAAVTRLYLDNIPHIKLPWVTVGKAMAQTALSFGVDDIGGAAFEERILEAAGGHTWQTTLSSDLPELVKSAGFEPIEAFGSYDTVLRVTAVPAARAEVNSTG